MFRWLRSLLASPPPDRTVPGPPPRGFVPPSSFTAHEYHFGQLQVLPRANAAFVAEEMAAIREHGYQEYSPAGFWRIHQRRPEPFPLAERHIALPELRSALAEMPLRRYQRVFVLDLSDQQRYPIAEAQAFGSDDCALVVEAAQDQVRRIWLGYRAAHHLPRRLFLLDTLLLLGQRYDLILVDWAQQQLLDLTDAAATARYLAP